ncbi:unnamed protein product [Notodromas monacha]|uniref:Peptidase S1 domain-containing protein n=1 Tax=Notodromas monacha TaxID=399045 RepID=A0A7R9GDL8_9CRUS|nr:unnamed protein product [Notodromas monacha]CAG0918669.1 unnamed protein product [Notodromas monacha]
MRRNQSCSSINAINEVFIFLSIATLFANCQPAVNFAKTIECGQSTASPTSEAAVFNNGSYSYTVNVNNKENNVSANVDDIQNNNNNNDNNTKPSIGPRSSKRILPFSSTGAFTASKLAANVAAVKAAVAQQLEHDTDVNLHIVGGSGAYRGEFPFIVSLVYGGRHFCGGAMIHESFVVTAAHCFLPRLFGSPQNPQNLLVRIREFVRSTRDPYEEDIVVIRAFVHEQWESSIFKGSIHDIALLQLAKPVAWDNYVQPICIAPQSFSTDAGIIATVIGWGTTTFGGQPSDSLQKVEVPVITNAKCRLMYMLNLLFHPNIDLSHICAGWRGGVDSCQGDSGGPLFVKIGNSYSLLGVVSEGFGCAKFLNPGKYTRAPFYLKWIRTHIDKGLKLNQDHPSEEEPKDEAVSKNRLEISKL